MLMAFQESIKINQTLNLDAIQLADTAKIYAEVNKYRDSLSEFLPWVSEVNCLADTENFANKAQQRMQNDESRVYVVRENGVIVGMISFVTLDFSASCAEFGYWLLPFAEGKGIISSAIMTLMEAYKEKIQSFHIFCSPMNLRSNLVAIRNEFIQVEDPLDMGNFDKEEQNHYQYQYIIT